MLMDLFAALCTWVFWVWAEVGDLYAGRKRVQLSCEA